MKHKYQGGYLASPGGRLTRPKRSIFAVLLCSFLALTFLAGTMGDFFRASPAQSSVVHADPSDDKETMDDSASDVGKDQAGFEKELDKAAQGDVDRNSFAYVLQRLFATQYMNSTQDGVAAGDFEDKEWQCDANDPHAGTAVYHNCDVPNIFTEFMQTLTSLLIPVGPQNAETSQAKVAFGFGIPSTIPGNGKVPVDPRERAVKYTALELYGYNLQYTNYRGEWDNIKVMTEARTLSNFGVMDSLRLGIATVVNGIVGGISEGADRFMEGLSKVDLLSAIGGFFTGLFEGGSSASVNTVLDTSDMNVFNTYAWYRVDYGPTLYRARELNQTEIAARIQVEIAAMLTKKDPSKVDLPQDFKNIQAGPPKPKGNISKCVAHTMDTTTGTPTKLTEITASPPPPGGISEGDCKEKAKAAPYNDSSPTWTVDGNQKKELIVDWKVTNQAIFATATKYKLECTISDEEADRQANLDKFYSCWTTAWNSLQSEVQQQAQGQVNQEWLDSTFSQDAIVKYFKDPAHNWNAPWARFVCTDENGKDLMKGTQPMLLFNSDGSYNSNCVKVRAPIQNGYYGNGWVSGSPGPEPQIDTRWAALDHYSIFDIFLKGFLVWGDSSSVGNWGLNVATFFTQASNAVIDLAFAPILTKLGLDTKIVSMLEAFRDSLYFPFISILTALAGLTILFQAGRRRAYATAFKDLALVVGTFMLGVIILFNPKGLITVVDEIPAQIETGIVGTIFNVGLEDDDGVCSAQQSSGGGSETDLEGNALNFSPRASIRTMECEIWRVFSFNPWVMGQWGTTYDQLYAKGNARAGGSTLTNSNESLVGDAPVYMGNGTVIHNWALYQLDATTIGTSTTEDVVRKSGAVSRNFYRLVDLQAGPNNGAGTDSRYFSSWSGDNAGVRNAVGAMAGLVSIVGFVTIVAFSILKIEIALLTAIMLLFAPIFLLLGVHPTFGRAKLKQYTGTIVALMLQRLILVTLLAVMLKMLTAVSLATQNYMVGGLLAAGVCAAFLHYRKEIFSIVNGSVANATGGLFSQDALEDSHGKFKQMLPMSVRNRMDMAKATAVNSAGGFVGGFVGGGVSGGVKAAKEASELGRHRLRNKQRRTGVGALTKFTEAQQAGEAVGKEALAKKDEAKGVVREAAVVKSLNSKFTARRNSDLHEKGEAVPTDGEGNATWMNVDPEARMNKKDLAALTPILSRISQLEKEAASGVIPGVKTKAAPNDIEGLKRETRLRKEASDARQVEIASLKEQAAVIEDRLYYKNADHISYNYFDEAAQAENDVEKQRRNEVKAGMSPLEEMSFETARMKSDLRALSQQVVGRVSQAVEDVHQEVYNAKRDLQEGQIPKRVRVKVESADKTTDVVKGGEE